MKKVLKILTVLAAVAALGGVCVSAAYAQMVQDEVTQLRRESRSDIVYLRTRVRELELALEAGLSERAEEEDLPVDGVIEEETTESTAETEAESERGDGEDGAEAGAAAEDESDEEAVTVPTHHAPETQAPIEEEAGSVSPTALYMLTVYNGMIGVFDASGELVRTINVFVMTLPDEEQAALAVGIPAYSEGELLPLIERYE